VLGVAILVMVQSRREHQSRPQRRRLGTSVMSPLVLKSIAPSSSFTPFTPFTRSRSGVKKGWRAAKTRHRFLLTRIHRLSPTHFGHVHLNPGSPTTAKCPQRAQMSQSPSSLALIALNSPLSTQYGHRLTFARLCSAGRKFKSAMGRCLRLKCQICQRISLEISTLRT
jgi:hypothetical protein